MPVFRRTGPGDGAARDGQRRLRAELKRLLPLVRPDAPLLVGILLLGVVSALAESVGVSLFIPFLQAFDVGTPGAPAGASWLVDRLGGLFASVPEGRRVTVVALCILASLVVKSGVGYGYGLLISQLDARFGLRLRDALYERLLGMEYRAFERADHGELLNTVATESWGVISAVQTVLQAVITATLTALYVALLLLISWPLTLAVGAALLGMTLLSRLFDGRVRRLGEETTAANAALASRMVEVFPAMPVVRAFGREGRERDLFHRASARVSRVGYRMSRLTSLLGPLYEVLSAVVLVSMLLVGLDLGVSVAALLVFVFVLNRLQPKVRSLDGMRLQLVSVGPALAKVTGLLDAAGVIPEPSSATAPRLLEREVAFSGVTFSYRPEWGAVLRDLDLRIPAQKTTAVVGLSGAGKSTLLRLLLRFYEPDRGAVRVDGVPLAEVDLAAWRRGLAYVSQDVFTFNATVRDNIAYGRPDATDAEVREAARLADADRFIEALDDGYDTRLGDGGVQLSGGQRQRITLARAIARDPDLLLLDEATNALDTISEDLIQKALDTLGGGRTVVLVAHRLSTVERADHIVVLEEGRVLEEGTLEELVGRDGRFAQLYRLQHRTALRT